MNQDNAIIQFPFVLAEPIQSPAQEPVAPDKDADTWDFSYIPPEHRAAVGDATQAIQTGMANIIQNLFEIGKHLTHVKELLEHGTFRTWFEQEFGLKERKAQHLMNIYRRLGTKVTIFRQLKPTALYHLAMPSTPEAAIAIVEEKILAGERLSVQQVMAIIAACTQPAPCAEENQAAIAARLAKALRTACTALSNQTVADCEWLLGETAAVKLDELRIELDSLRDQVQCRPPQARRPAAEWTVVSAPTPSLFAQAFGVEDSVSQLPGTVTGQTLDGSVFADEWIVPGCTVSVQDEDTGQDACYTLVMDEPGKPEAGRIHWDSPVARALRNKRVGEIVTANTPDGPIRLAIIGIRIGNLTSHAAMPVMSD